MLEHNIAYTSQAIDRLISQFRSGEPDAPNNLERLLNAFSAQAQAAEDAVWQLYTERSLSTAAGAQLDALGTIVGEERQGSDDIAYRGRITVRIAINTSRGRIDEIASLMREYTKVITGFDAPVHIIEEYPAAIFARIEGALPDPQLAKSIITTLTAAGVSAFVIYDTNIDPLMFHFADGATPEASATQGFNDSATPPPGGTGGEYAGVI